MNAENSEKFIRVVAAVIYRDTNADIEVAIFRRGPGTSGSGHYEFPGGKVEPGESEAEALRREITEELGVEVAIGALVGETYHRYPAKNVHLRFYWVKDPGQSFTLSDHDDFRWLMPNEIDPNILSEGDREILRVLQTAGR